MDNVINKILNHPIATWIVISAMTGGVANIVRACKGDKVVPVVSVIENTPTTE